MGDHVLVVQRLQEEADGVLRVGLEARLVEHGREGLHHAVGVAHVAAGVVRGRGAGLPEAAVGGPDLAGGGLDLHLVLRDLGVRHLAEVVGMDEGEVRHVEEVLDHAQARDRHADAAAVDDAAAGFGIFGEREEGARGAAAGADPDIAVVRLHGQRLRAEAALRRAIGCSPERQCFAEQAGGMRLLFGRTAEGDRGPDDQPVVEHVGIVGDEGHRGSFSLVFRCRCADSARQCEGSSSHRSLGALRSTGGRR